jgi:predicted transcriptional regulator
MSNLGDSLSARSDDVLKFASDIVAAYVSNNPIAVSEIPGMIKSIHGTLGGLAGATSADAPTTQKPAIPVKRSVTPEYIICLEDGKKLKMLKRYLRSRYRLTPEEYRTKWGLPADYPMVAPNYAAQRSEFAKKIGLGRTSAPATKSRRRG